MGSKDAWSISIPNTDIIVHKTLYLVVHIVHSRSMWGHKITITMHSLLGLGSMGTKKLKVCMLNNKINDDLPLWRIPMWRKGKKREKTPNTTNSKNRAEQRCHIAWPKHFNAIFTFKGHFYINIPPLTPCFDLVVVWGIYEKIFYFILF
jgi:hypothetical protein